MNAPMKIQGPLATQDGGRRRGEPTKSDPQTLASFRAYVACVWLVGVFLSSLHIILRYIDLYHKKDVYNKYRCNS